MKALSAVVALAVAGTASARTFTIYNQCPFTIWVFDLFSSFDRWAQDAYQTVSFYVPDNWLAGRIWARRDCDFSTNPGPNSCLDGGCNGGLECDPHTGTGVPPASLAEFTLGINGLPDNYDVSLVDGYNLPIRVSNNAGCPVADCPVDLGPNCPAPLKGPFDSSGFPVGCKSACLAGLGGDPANNYDCCTGSHNTAATCPSSNVDYYSYFKNNCPNAYAYAYDEASGSSLYTCPANLAADYTITFCP
ncbi:thaumatin-like protein [Dichomitus squalens LYAD-421 SS1]|uniref:thaumatin-like protein n=1 Tax=Dichomitus squalens (strain LYAD-421) TaxID=732165 RepID=UPI0004411053|nr:thaumatin-like protein [Dichomitus squalens LYAD-421 SS1]EJF64590.1 thaumatin-like protein [Dichomitus squalens LYAD-421 SS1]